MTTLAIAPSPHRSPIRCTGCQQLIAWRLTRSGALVVLCPAVSDEPDGSVRIECPSCGKRVRVKQDAA